jgi:pimeloyl-ACP methyl ester carboxylesterase
LAHLRPAGLIAAHVNWQFVFPATLPDDQQATRPQTIGYALADSAAGQALWIYEKFAAWTDNHGDPENTLSIDAMLDNISLYWFTNTAASSARMYWENTHAALADLGAVQIELPMAASVFPKEIFRPVRTWAEALWPNLFYWNELDRGGHLAAFEQPALFTEEIRNAFISQRGTAVNSRSHSTNRKENH